MKQITIFDILTPDEPKPDEPKTITYGYIKDFRVVGQELTFQELVALLQTCDFFSLLRDNLAI